MKGAVISLLLLSTLYIVIRKFMVSCFQFSSFDLPLFTHSASLKVIYCRNLRYFAKRAVILLLLQSTLYVTVSKFILSLFQFFYFDLQLFTLSVCVKLTFFLQSWAKYLEQNREIKQNWAGKEKFNIYFCVFLLLLPNFNFWKGDWTLGYVSIQN